MLSFFESPARSSKRCYSVSRILPIEAFLLRSPFLRVQMLVGLNSVLMNGVRFTPRLWWIGCWLLFPTRLLKMLSAFSTLVWRTNVRFALRFRTTTSPLESLCYHPSVPNSSNLLKIRFVFWTSKGWKWRIDHNDLCATFILYFSYFHH